MALNGMPLLLLIDDEPAQKRLVSALAARAGWRTIYASDLETALATLGTRDGMQLDAVLIDHWNPNIRLVDTIIQIRDRRPALPILVLTSQNDVHEAVESMRAGATDYLAKPIAPDRFLAALNSVLDRSEEHSGELRPLTEKLSAPLAFNEIVGGTPHFLAALAIAAKAARTRVPVLIEGESGVGKEVIAQAIHAASPRHRSRMVAVNCGAIPTNLVESELFGHERGAFTGAERRRMGRFELAKGGTLMLDEIGEVPLTMQVKLLRILEERRFERLGGEEEIVFDARLIAATNRDLQEEVNRGNFRSDLYFRINVVQLHIPPLRERREDIIPLVDHFLKLSATKLNRPQRKVTPAAKDLLLAHDWPGNVRELANVIERATVLSRTETLDAVDFSQLRLSGAEQGAASIPLTMTLRDLEMEHIQNVLKANEFSLQKSADILGIHRNTLRQKMKEYGIGKPNGDDEN